MDIDGFVFNFRCKCNMCCDFCFIPFEDNSSLGDLKHWKEIIDYLLKYNPKIITFGGGDPLNAPKFLELVKYTKSKGLNIHVDTNGIALNSNMYSDIITFIDVLGLPLDGVQNVHDTLRNYKGHYNIVMDHLNFFNKNNYKVKINTVITKYNYESLIELAKILNEYNIQYWSLYEYWYFKGINQLKYNLNHSKLEYTIKRIKHVYKNEVRFSRINDRKNEHIFISSCGNFYIVDKRNYYLELGNFHDYDIDNKLLTNINLSEISKRCNRKIV